ncbi:MAG: SagB/ThcOx family dehydrogenase, partial [Candidatus Binatia bacterium]
MADDDGGSARRYHERTKHSLASLRSGPHGLDWANQPLPFKTYQGVPGEELPRAFAPSGTSAREAIRGRAASRRDAQFPNRAALARLLFFSLGIVRRRELADGRRIFFRAAPCTGALYHVDAYLIAAELPDLAAGVYHFGAHDFSLRRLRAGDWRGVLVEASGGEARIADAPATLVLASTYWRNAWKYRARAYRHVFWDGGTALAQLFAQANADGWPVALVLGFTDATVERLCGLDPAREGVVALVPVGERGAAAARPAPHVPPLDLPT